MATVAYEHIKSLIAEHGMNQVQFADFLNRSGAVVTNLFNGDRRLQLDEAEKISDRFGVTVDYVLYGTKGGVAAMKIDIRGTVPGGNPMECEDLPSEGHIYYPMRGNPTKIFALRVVGNSMNNIAPDGSYVIVDSTRKNPIDLDGKPVIAYANGETTFKRFYTNPTMLVPDSTDKSLKPIVLNGRWEIIGAVVGAIKSLD